MSEYLNDYICENRIKLHKEYPLLASFGELFTEAKLKALTLVS